MNLLLKTLLFFLLGLPYLGYAQKGKIELGIEGGPSLTSLRGNQNNYKYKPVIKSSVGLSFQYHFSNLISLRTGINYETKGYTSTLEKHWSPDSTTQVDFSTSFNYLTIPVSARFQFGKKVKFFINAGIYLGILVNKSNNVKGNLSGFYTDGFDDPIINYRNPDFGISGGFGIGIPIKERWTVFLETRGNFGLANIRKDFTGFYFNTGVAATYSVNLLAGISYAFFSNHIAREHSRFTQKHRFEIGIEGGPNVSPFMENKPYGQNDLTYSSIQPGFSGSAGFSFQWNSPKHFSLRTGIIFQQNNYSFNTNYSDVGIGIGGNGKGKHHFDYLTLPILARFTYGQKIRFFFNTGLFAGLLTKQTEFSEGIMYYPYGGGFASSYKNKVSNISDYKNFDLGVIAGIGLSIPIQKRLYLSLELRDNFGITNILYSNYYKRTLRTNSLNLLMGISYKLGFRETKK